MKLSEDKTKAEIAISGSSLSAHELEELIAQLSDLRAEMAPEVPEHLEASKNAMVFDEPIIDLRARIGGKVNMWIRHGGFGWIGLSFSARQCTGIREFFNSMTSDPKSGENRLIKH